jgi:hypothetical protein
MSDSIISSDTTTLPVDTLPIFEVIGSLPCHSGKSDSILYNSSFIQIKDTSSKSFLPIVSLPETHAGIPRPESTFSESFLLAIIFLVTFFFCKLIGGNNESLSFNFKKLLSTDERNYTTNTLAKRFSPVFWLMDIIILSYASRIFVGHFEDNQLLYRESGQLWFLILYVAAFWIVWNIIMFLIGSVFFKKTQIEIWFSYNKLILDFFSLSLLPLVIVSETGTNLTDWIYYWWPVIFLVLPKIVQYIQAPKLFSLRNGGYFYLILYLCALEILPILIFIKGLFLLK